MGAFLEVLFILLAIPEFAGWLYKKLFLPLVGRLVLSVAILVRHDKDPLDTEEWMSETLGIAPPGRVLAPPVEEDKSTVGFLNPIPGLHPLEVLAPEPPEVEALRPPSLSRWLVSGHEDSAKDH